MALRHFFLRAVERPADSFRFESIGRIRNERGNVVWAMIFSVLTATSLLILLADSEFSGSSELVLRDTVSMSLDNLNYSLRRSFEDPSALAQTIHSPLNSPGIGATDLRKCLTDPTHNCPRGEFDLVVFGPKTGEIVNDPRALSAGTFLGIAMIGGSCSHANCAAMAWQDLVCDSFNVDRPNTFCEFRFRTTWAPDCPPTGSCRQPRIILRSRLEASFGGVNAKRIPNPERYNIDQPL